MIKRRCAIKRLTVFFIIAVFTFAFAAEGLAQEQEQAKTIFSYKRELDLTNKQEEKLKKLIADFQKYLTDTRKELGQLQSELAGLMRTKASLWSIKTKIQKISQLQGEMAYTDIETARNVENVLTASQLAKWNRIQQDSRKTTAAQVQAAQQAQNTAATAKK